MFMRSQQRIRGGSALPLPWCLALKRILIAIMLLCNGHCLEPTQIFHCHAAAQLHIRMRWELQMHALDACIVKVHLTKRPLSMDCGHCRAHQQCCCIRCIPGLVFATLEHLTLFCCSHVLHPFLRKHKTWHQTVGRRKEPAMQIQAWPPEYNLNSWIDIAAAPQSDQ